MKKEKLVIIHCIWLPHRVDGQIIKNTYEYYKAWSHTSSLPGRMRASSIMSRLLVMPITRMLLSCSTPSILASSWLTTVSWTPVLLPVDPRALQIASISSKIMMCNPLFGPNWNKWMYKLCSVGHKFTELVLITPSARFPRPTSLVVLLNYLPVPITIIGPTAAISIK